MSAVIELAIEGIGICAAGLADWAAAREVLRGTRPLSTEPFARPAPGLLAPNERRRAPDSVLLALAVAEQACTMAQRAPRDLPNVFASSYGDLTISDYLCTVLAQAPRDLSPTKFHNSVHNAAAGYWTIASGCMASSTALSAGSTTFATGLLEAAAIAASESTPVLYAAFDTAAVGPLTDVIACDAPFGVAFVLAPVSGSGVARLRIALSDHAAAELAPLPASLQALRERNPAAASLPLLNALARGDAAGFDFALHGDKDLPSSALHLEISF
jgi:hypothetical protein